MSPQTGLAHRLHSIVLKEYEGSDRVAQTGLREVHRPTILQHIRNTNHGQLTCPVEFSMTCTNGGLVDMLNDFGIPKKGK